MHAAARQARIAEVLSASGECSVGALARELGVSEMTVRRDLQSLAEAGRVLRTHGGAAPAERVSFEFQFLHRTRERRAEKEAIASAAAALVGDGASVMLDSGTTTLAIAARLKEKRGLTVITTSLPIASELQFAPNARVILLGGVLRQDAPDLFGPLTESNLECLSAEVAFIGADAIDAKGNVYNAAPDVARMLQIMAKSARRVYVVADSRKIGGTALMRFGRVAEWDGLITDNGLSKTMAQALRRAGAHVIQAPAMRTSRNGN